MALIDCPECGRYISDKAIACPNCAYPINLPQSASNYSQTVPPPIPANARGGKRCPLCGGVMTFQLVAEIPVRWFSDTPYTETITYAVCQNCGCREECEPITIIKEKKKNHEPKFPTDKDGKPRSPYS